MSTGWTRVAAGLLAFLAAGDGGEGPTLESNRRARALLSRALEAHGGRERLEEIRTLRWSFRGTETLLDQGPRPEAPWFEAPRQESLAVDLRAERLRHEFRSERRGYTWEEAAVADGARGFRLSPERRRATALVDAGFGDRGALLRERTPLLLREAWARAHTATTVSDTAVRVAFEDGVAWTLLFDAETGRLAGYEHLAVDATFGDVVVRTDLLDHRSVDGLVVPGRVRSRIGGRPSRDIELVELAVDAPLPAELFGVPEGWETGAAPPRPRHALTRIAPGVHVLEQIEGVNANAMLVELGDDVLVVEAPEESEHAGLGEAVIATARELLPDRTVRWVVPSHHHVDHGAGLRPYVALGATVIATPGNAGFVERLAAAPFELRPDALARAPRKPSVALLEGRRLILEAGGRRVEMRDVGPDSHVDETIATWLPGERILFLADQFETGYAEDVRWDGGGRLGEVLGAHGWDPLWIVAPHSRPRRMEDLRPDS